MSINNRVNILWTGGWDSSYRLVELSKQSVEIQPIYIYGDGRRSEHYERRAMKKILNALLNKKETVAHINSIKFVHKDSIPLNNNITYSYQRICRETQLGSQHEWLSRYAYENPGIELGTENAPINQSKILKTIDKYGELIYDAASKTYVLNEKSSTPDVVNVLGNFRYPIIDKSGREMVENIKNWGYEDVMSHVWVCHTPIFGEPCGVCHPCELKIETDMDFLMTPRSLKRYSKKRNIPLKYIYTLEKKISYLIDGIRFNT